MHHLQTLAVLLGLALALPAMADESEIRDFKAVDAAFLRHQVKYTGNPDVDFRKQLISRREDIINMAEVAIARANESSTEQLAQQTIEKQKREISELQAWLDAHHR